jgi:predicted outer membrane repeat protein
MRLRTAVIPSVLTLLASCVFSSSTWALDATVGNGTPASCTDSELTNAINTVQSDVQGGVVRFNCGAAFHTIISTAPKILSGLITIDGGGTIAIGGGGVGRILEVNPRANPTELTQVSLRNITLTAGNGNPFGGAILVNADTELSLDNVEISDSVAFTSGGAIATFANVILNITNSRFINNRAPNGGAIATRAVVSITGSLFTRNTATTGEGGAIQSYEQNLTVDDSSFSFNRSSHGAAIYKSDAILLVNRSTIESNFSTAGAGTIDAQASTELVIRSSRLLRNNQLAVFAKGRFVAESSLFDSNAQGALRLALPNLGASGVGARITACTFSNNFKGIGNGAAMLASADHANGRLEIENSTFANNNAMLNLGSDIFVSGSVATRVLSSTFVGARNDTSGGGSSIANQSPIPLVLRSSAIVAAQGTACSGAFSSQGANIGEASCNLTFAGNANFIADVIVGSVFNLGLSEFAYHGSAFNSYLPQLGSPLLNTHDCGSGTDGRGLSRPIGARCDTGAVERQFVEPPSILFRNGFE